VHGCFEGLALDVPQGHIQRSQRVDFLPAGRVEPFHIHPLPEGFDLEWVLSDQASGALLQRVLGAAFSDAGEAGVGLHRAKHIALIEKLVEVWRLIDPHPRDLRRRQRGLGVWQTHECSG
jgi:hypothetical protein